MYVWLIPLVIDLLVRIPMLSTIAETLGVGHPGEGGS